MAGPDGSPTLRKLELRTVLREHRRRLGMSGEQVSAAVNEAFADSFSPAKLSRIESGQQIPLPRDVSELASVYDLDRSERERLIQLARDARKRGWWQEYSKMGDVFATYVDLESAAVSMRNYESTFVPGLLQTPEYAHAVVTGLNPTYTPEDVEQLVTVRMKRQERLRGSSPLRLHAVIQENALRRTIGSPQVMADQVEHLQSLADLPNVTIQIVRYNTGLYQALQTASFALFDFADARLLPTVCYIEGIFWNLFVEEDEQKTHIIDAFGELADSVASSSEVTRQVLVNIHDKILRGEGT